KEWKNEKGVKTKILDNDDFSKYSGEDKAEKIRNMIKDYYETEDIEWVLLAGDAEDSLIPIRYVYNPDTTQVDGTSETYGDSELKPTDFYYADLNGTWDNNSNGVYGESVLYAEEEEIEWTPEVYVGRFPASTSRELEIMVNKTINYETNMSRAGEWMNRMLLGGGISDDDEQNDIYEDEARLTQYIWQNYVLSEMNFTHLYETTEDFEPDNTSGTENLDIFDEKFDNGYSTVIFAGHGDGENLKSLADSKYILDDAKNSNNYGMPSLFYGDACSTAPYDLTDEIPNDANLGETLIKRENAGAIGYIGGLRVTWYFTDDTNLEMLNRGNAKLFWKAFFEEGKYQQGKALYDSKVDYMVSDYFQNYYKDSNYDYLQNEAINAGWERKNLLTYNLLGDPEVDIYTRQPQNISDPFTSPLYEGQIVSLDVKNNNDQKVPYARVHLTNQDGAYRTVYADDDGEVSFRLPPEANTTFNATITGHNTVPSYFNFTTAPDTYLPTLSGYTDGDREATVSENLCFDVNSHDNESGVESVFTLISKNNFKDYHVFPFSNKSMESEDAFHCKAHKLDPGSYKYLFVSRDYANNHGIYYRSDLTIFIETPLTNYILLGFVIISISVVGGSIVVNRRQKEKYLKSVAYNEPPSPELFSHKKVNISMENERVYKK
ncbi:MAG: C25 family cysteine peptidase, partial [Promethearchaeia archaeon]